MRYTRYEFKGINSRKYTGSVLFFIIAAVIFVLLTGFILSRFIIIPGLTKLWYQQAKNSTYRRNEMVTASYIICRVTE
jgi:uncharacterized protein HemY